MTTTAINASRNHDDPDDSRVALWLRLALFWHGALVVAGLAGAAALWRGAGSGLPLWLRLLATILLLLLAVGSGTAVPLINRRDHRGRVLSLALNYLGLLFSLVAAFHLLNLFVGIDSLAGRFGRGLPWLGLAFLGYLLGALGDRFEFDPARQRRLRQAGRAVIASAALLFLLTIGLLNGLVAVAARLTGPAPFLALAGVLLFGLFIWAMWRAPAAVAFGATNADAEMLNGYLFLSPNLLGFLVFFAGPLVLSLYVSFTNWDAFGTRDWIGLTNYGRIFNLTLQPLAEQAQLANQVLDVRIYDELTRFTLFGRSFVIGAQDKLFWIALGNTLKFVLMAVPLSVVPALFLANLLNSKIPGMTFFRAVYFLPSVAAVVGIALVWQWLFNSTVGYINYGITLAVQFLQQLNLPVTDPQIRWLSSSNTALLAVVIMAAWQWLGFNTVLFLAGLQNIPGELYEAATVDGANAWSKFWRLTVPLLAPTTFFVLTTTVIQAMQVFEQVFILIPGQNPAGPGNSTLTMVLYLYQKGFQRFEQGYASAIAWVLFLIIFGATLFQFQRQRSGGAAYDV